MGMHKAIRFGKEHRRTYEQRGRQSAAVDPTCRPHGGGHRWACPVCERDRLVHVARQKAAERLAMMEAA